MITSMTNKRIKNVMALSARAKERKKQKSFVAEGIKMFMEAPDTWIREIYIAEDFDFAAEEHRELAQRFMTFQQDENVVAELVKTDIFQKMSDTRTPQGVLTVLKMPEYEVEQVLSMKKERGKGLFLVLEDIQDPGNLGTMMRAGEGAGISGVIMSSHTVDMFNPKTIRATMGSIYRVPFVYVEDLQETLGRMKKSEIKTYAAHLKGQKDYDKESYQGATAFLIGNEGNGLSKEIADMAECYIKIPMLGEVESLNAAIAASLLTYEAARQRRN